MRVLFWVLAGVGSLIVASFVVSNRQPVELGLWPLPDAYGLPLWLIVFLALAAGFVAGWAVDWWRHGRVRADRRRHARRVQTLEAELAQTRADQAAAKPESRALVG
jgi:uncharacterized integral membrane protein